MASRPAHAGSTPDGASTLVLEAGDARATILPLEGGRFGSLVVGGRELLVTGDPDPCAGAATRWRRSPAASATGGSRSAGSSTGCRRGCRPMRSTAWSGTGRGASRTRATLSIDLDERWPFRGRVVQRFALDERLAARRAHARGRGADAGDHRLAPVVPPGARPRRPVGHRRPRRRRDAGPRRGGDPQRGAPRRRRPALGTTRSRASTADPTLTWPGRLRLRLSSTCSWWIAYTEPEHAVCVEPQSGPPDAVNGDPEIVEPAAPLVHTMSWRWDRVG